MLTAAETSLYDAAATPLRPNSVNLCPIAVSGA